MSDAPVIRALVAGHGGFAEGIVSAVEMITGRGASLVAFSARGLSGNDIEDSMRRLIADHDIRVVFTDLQAGSCTMAARKTMRSMPDHLIVSGVNLPMLIDFVFAEKLSPVEAARHAFERGRSAMSVIGGKP